MRIDISLAQATREGRQYILSRPPRLGLLRPLPSSLKLPTSTARSALLNLRRSARYVAHPMLMAGMTLFYVKATVKSGSIVTVQGSLLVIVPSQIALRHSCAGWWPQCCAQIHQQLCCPFTDNNDVTYFTWSSRNVTQLVAYLCKITYRYACIVLKESVWLLPLRRHCHRATYEGGEEGDAIDVCVADHGSLTARGKEHLITSCRRYASVIHMI